MKEKVNNGNQSFMIGVMTLLIAQIVVKVLGLIYRVVITNIDGFGDVGNALYGMGYQIYTLLLAISSIGVPNAISKLVSERIAVGKNKEAHEIFKTALILFSIIGLIAGMILFFGSGPIANIMGNKDVQGVMMALSPAILFVSLAAVIRGYFNGMYNMKATSNSQMLEQLFKSIFTIAFVQVVAHISIANSSWLADLLHITAENRTTAMAIAGNAASTFATMIGCLYLVCFYQKRKKQIWKDINNSKGEYKKEKRTKIMKRILAVSIPISLASIVSAINRNIDNFTIVNCLKYALAGWTTISEAIAGWETIPETIIKEATRLNGILSGKIDILVGMPAALNVAFATALVPAISGAIANADIKTARRRITFSIRTTLLIAFPCTIGMCVLAEPILNLLFPNAYAPEAAVLLQISAFTIIFTLMNQTIGGALQGLGKVFVPAISLGVSAITKLILNLTLIPNFELGVFGGINGAAVSSVVASMVAMIINLTVLCKTIKLNMSFAKTVIKPLVVSSAMGALTYLLYDLLYGLNLAQLATIISIIVAILMYIIFIIVFKIFDKDDYHMLPYGDKIYNFLVKVKLAKP